MSVAALIPAYQPNELLLETVENVRRVGFSRIIVVNDGSKPECDRLFEQLHNVTLLKHERNQGKGAALKTGQSYIHDTAPPDEVGVVTLDADGQHRAEDAWLCAQELERNPQALVLGVRSFTRKGVPLVRMAGNVLTRAIFFMLVGRFIRDTQTGLRALPKSWLPELGTIVSNGYEYELEVLLFLRKRPLRQVTIQTVYIGENESSHFNLWKDSVRIYGTLLKSRLRALKSWFARRLSLRPPRPPGSAE